MIPPPVNEVWIGWGDSEMGGVDDPANLAPYLSGYPPASGLKMLRTGEAWTTLSEPCANGIYPGVGLGPAGIFGYLRGQAIGKTVAVINGGVGGSRTDQWVPGQANFESLLLRAKAAVTRDGSYLGGYLCYIGANDAAAGTTAWDANSLTTFDALREACGIAPVVFAVLPPTVPTDMTYSTWATIRAQQQAWAAPDRIAVDVPEGYWREAYKLHLSAQGNYLLAQSMLAALGGAS